MKEQQSLQTILKLESWCLYLEENAECYKPSGAYFDGYMNAVTSMGKFIGSEKRNLKNKINRKKERAVLYRCIISISISVISLAAAIFGCVIK